MAQVFGKHLDSFFIGSLFAGVGKLGFNRWSDESFISIIAGFAYKLLAFAQAMNIFFADFFCALFAVNINIDFQEALTLTTTHGQQAVTAASFERFTEFKIVGKLLCPFFLPLAFHCFGSDNRFAPEYTSYLLAHGFIFTDGFCYDVFCTCQRFINTFYISFKKAFGNSFGLLFALQQQDCGQRFKSVFTRNLCLCSSFRLERQINIL